MVISFQNNIRDHIHKKHGVQQMHNGSQVGV